MTKVLLADDHPFILAGLLSILTDTDYQVVGALSSGEELLEQLSKLRPDILLMDVSMPGHSGLDVLRILRSRGDQRIVVLLTASLDDQNLLEALNLGVQGIVLKESAQHLLLECLATVRDGKRWIQQDLLQRALHLTAEGGSGSPLDTLTAKERAVAELVSNGRRNREVASQLGMSEGTVKVYLHRIYEKLAVSSRTELSILMRR
jgi:two-component system nitrate/nitrite response regulator NarP